MTTNCPMRQAHERSRALPLVFDIPLLGGFDALPDVGLSILVGSLYAGPPAGGFDVAAGRYIEGPSVLDVMGISGTAFVDRCICSNRAARTVHTSCF